MRSVAGGRPRPLRLFAQRQDIALLFELADDGGDGLDGEADAAGDVAAGDGAVQADGLQHDAPVVRPSELLVGPPQCHVPLPWERQELHTQFIQSNGIQK